MSATLRHEMAVTLKDVAKLAGTSASAASAVLNQGGGKNTRVGPQTRERIISAAAELGYVPNPIAQSLATGRTGALGLMLPYESSFLYPDPWSTSVINGIVSEAVRSKFNLTLYTAIQGHYKDDVSRVVDHRVDGVIVVLPIDNPGVYEICAKIQLPLVSILREPTSPDELVVNSNDAEGARLATQHLIDLGHRKIGMITGWELVPTMEGRARGFYDCLRENGLQADPRHVIRGDFNRLDGRFAVEELIKLGEDMPTAIFCCNDMCAHGVIDALRESGYSVPRDISVVGYDDTPYAALINPPLTTVNMAADQLGSTAVNLLVADIQGQEIADRQPVLSVSLTVRESTAKVRRPD